MTNGSTLFLGGNLIMNTNTQVYFNIGTNNTVGPAGGSDYIWVGGTNAQFKNPRMFLTLAGPLTPSARPLSGLSKTKKDPRQFVTGGDRSPARAVA